MKDINNPINNANISMKAASLGTFVYIIKQMKTINEIALVENDNTIARSK